MKMHTVLCFISGSSRVAAHKKTHAERECVCTMCGKKFINKHKLKIHEDGVHGSDALYPVITTCSTENLPVSVLFQQLDNNHVVEGIKPGSFKEKNRDSRNCNEKLKPRSCSLMDLGKPSPLAHISWNLWSFFRKF